MKKWLSLILTVAMLAVITVPACAEDADRFGKYAEPIDISVLSIDMKSAVTEYDSSNPARKSATENAWIDAYRDYLNINVNRIVAEDYTALDAKLNTGMASDSLPDIMIVGKGMFYVLAENGVLHDLQAALDGYAQKQQIQQVLDSDPESLSWGMYDGQLLGIPCISNSFINSEVLWIRQDWLDKVGMTAPTTIDEMIAVAKAFQEAKLGGENTIGLGMTNVSASFIDGFGAVPDTWMKQEDGSYVYGTTAAPVRDALLKLQEMYKDGIIKTDFAVTDILNEEVANGVCGMYYGPTWHGVTNISASLQNDENAAWTCVRLPSVDGSVVKQWTNTGTEDFYVVNAKCEHPEALLKMLELELHMMFEATPEESAKYYINDDGYAMWNIKVFRNFTRATQALGLSDTVVNALAEGLKSVDDPMAKADYAKVYSAQFEGNREHLGRLLTYTQAYQLVKQLRDDGVLVTSYHGPITENMSLYQGTINEALNNAMLKVVMGEDIAVYDEAVKTWYATGGQAITDDVNAYYQAQ